MLSGSLIKSGVFVVLWLLALAGISPNTRIFVSGELVVPRRLTVANGDDEVKLQCPTKDVDGDFYSVLWLLHEEHLVIGTGAEFDHSKYFYFPSTGELAIQNVTYDDTGIYRCILQQNGSQNVKQKPSAIRLVVIQPFKDLWEEQYRDNLIRAVICASIALSFFALVGIVHTFRWREPNYMRYATRDTGRGMYNLGLELEPHQQQYCGKFEIEDQSRRGSGQDVRMNSPGTITESIIDDAGMCNGPGVTPTSPVKNPIHQVTQYNSRI